MRGSEGDRCGTRRLKTSHRQRPCQTTLVPERSKASPKRTLAPTQRLHLTGRGPEFSVYFSLSSGDIKMEEQLTRDRESGWGNLRRPRSTEPGRRAGPPTRARSQPLRGRPSSDLKDEAGTQSAHHGDQKKTHQRTENGRGKGTRTIE